MSDFYSQLQRGDPILDFHEQRRLADINASRQEDVESPEAIDILRAARESSFVTDTAFRAYERRSSQFDADLNWELDEETHKRDLSLYNPKEQEYLHEARSLEERKARKTWIEEDRERRAVLSKAGGWGVASEIGLSMFDPVQLGLGFATGGLAYSAKAGKVANTIRGAGVGMSESVAIDALLMTQDTQSDVSDLIYSLTGGAVIGGALGALSRSKIDIDLKNDGEILAHQKANEGLKEATEQGKAETAETRASSTVSYEADTAKMQSDKVSHERQLEADVEGRLSRAEAKKLAKQREELLGELDEVEEELIGSDAELFELRSNVTEAESDVARAAGSVRSTKEDLLRTAKQRLAVAVRKRDLRILNKQRSINEKLRDIEDRLSKAKRAKSSANQLRKWRAMSPDEQYQHLYEGDLPSKELSVSEEETILQNMAEEAAEEIDTKAPEAPLVGGSASAAAVAPSFAQELFRASKKHVERLQSHFDIGRKIDSSAINWTPAGKEGWMAKNMNSLYTYLSSGNSYTMKGLVHELFENPQGGKANATTAAALRVNEENKIRGAMKARKREGFSDFAKHRGLSSVKRWFGLKDRNDFDKMVMIEVLHPGTYSSVPGVKKAAEGVSAQFMEAANRQKAAGVRGFEDLDVKANHVTRKVNEQAVFHGIAGNQRSRQTTKAVLSEAYFRGDNNLTREQADYIAEAYIIRAENRSSSITDVYRKANEADIDRLAEALEAAGLPSDEIRKFMDTSMEAEANRHISNRAKLSLRPDLRAEVDGVQAIDLFHNNLDHLLEEVTQAAAGATAMAKKGFKSRHEFDDYLEAVREEAIRNGNPAREVDDRIEVMKAGVDMIYGRSPHDQAHKGWYRNLSRIRDLTSLLRLQMVGISAIPEASRGIVNHGLLTYTKLAPKSLKFIKGSKAYREGGLRSGDILDPEMDEVDQVVNYAGEDWVLLPTTIRDDAGIEESGFFGELGRKVDMAINRGRELQEVTSAHRLIQGGGETLAIRSTNYQIKQWIFEGKDLDLRQATLDETGWDAAYLDELKAWSQANPLEKEYNGRMIRVLNFEKMPADMMDRYLIGVQRIGRREMMRPYVGETPWGMHRVLGATITQFRTFSILSLEKQLLRDIKQDPIAGSHMAVWSAGLSFLGYGAYTLAAGSREQKESMFETQNLFMGIYNRMGQLASTSIGFDFLATLGVLPDSLTASPQRLGARTYGYNSIPVLGAARDAGNLTAQVGDFLTPWGDPTTEPTTGDILKGVQKILPFAKTIGIRQAYDALEEELE